MITKMSESICIVVDEEEVSFEVSELASLEKIIWGAKAPASLKGGGVEATAEVIEYMVDLTLEQTVLTRELLNEIPQEELIHLFEQVIKASFNGETDDVVRVSDGTSIGGSAFEDLGEWE